MKSWAEATNIEIDVFLLEITNLDDFSGHITFRVWLQLVRTTDHPGSPGSRIRTRLYQHRPKTHLELDNTYTDPKLI